MDKLYEIAKFYEENLDNRRFLLKAGKKGKILELNILFTSEQFKHLVGLHKLEDIPETKFGSRRIYRNILNGDLKYETIKSSKYYEQIEKRLEYFFGLKTTLFSNELMIKSLKGDFYKIIADFMLTKKDSKYGNAHLFLKNTEESIVLPVTYIIQEDNRYLENMPNKWKVLSVEEIVESDEIKEKNALKEKIEKRTNKQIEEVLKGEKLPFKSIHNHDGNDGHGV